MNHKQFITKTGKEINVYDGLFDSAIRDYFFRYAIASNYKIGWSDNDYEQAARHKYLHCVLNNQEANDSLIYPRFTRTESFKHVCNMEPCKFIINLSTASDTHFPHSHIDNVVALYYANLNWQTHWHGETLFFSEDLSEIDYAVKYTPGRLVIFDGSIPHSIRPQSNEADNYRITFTMMFQINKDLKDLI